MKIKWNNHKNNNYLKNKINSIKNKINSLKNKINSFKNKIHVLKNKKKVIKNKKKKLKIKIILKKLKYNYVSNIYIIICFHILYFYLINGQIKEKKI